MLDTPQLTETALGVLAQDIKRWAGELGFSQAGITDLDLTVAEERLGEWLDKGFHGELHYMARHGATRARPSELVPGTLRVIAVRMDYLPDGEGRWVDDGWRAIEEPERTNISVYARGRDYHRIVRAQLKRLALRVEAAIGPFGYRVFTDSAPVMEVELGVKAGLGWRGKHTLLLSREGGSMFFLGEIYVDLALPTDGAAAEHCGHCTKCIEICPTQAIVAPYQLDARRCISYLTIELAGSIPEEFRALIGNRVYGCDDCQLVCPWNKFAQSSQVDAFRSRGLENLALIEVFGWDEPTFLNQTEGSPIRRIGHQRWLRNVAVALGNALRVRPDTASRRAIESALRARLADPSELVREHVEWALRQSPPVLGGSAG